MLQWTNLDEIPTSSASLIPRGAARAMQEDHDSAPPGAVIGPINPSSPSPVLDDAILAVPDEPSGAIWTGHANGRVARWIVPPNKEVAVIDSHFQAHKLGAVLSLAVTPWGDIWTGSKNGSVRVWAYSSGVVIRGRPPMKIREAKTATGAKPHAKVHAIACSSSGMSVWTAGRTSINIWHSYSVVCLGSIKTMKAAQGSVGTGVDSSASVGGGQAPDGMNVVNVERGLERRLFERPPMARQLQPEPNEAAENDLWDSNTSSNISLQVMKGVSGLGRFAKQLGKGISKAMASSSGPSDDPSGGGVGSRRVMGDKGKIRTLLPTLDGCFIVAFKDGMIEKYTEFGRLLWSVDLSTRISSLSLVAGGSVAWVGCADGTVRVLNFSDLGSTENGGGGGGVGVAQSWQAHLFPVISIAQVGTKVFTLANDGSVRGWSLNLPSQAEIDAWHLAQSSALQPHKVRVLAGSWNVGEKKPARESLVQWLGKRASEVNADIVCVGLQEMEMGTGSVAMDAAKIVLRPDMLEKGNANAQWWMSEIEAAIQSSCQCTFDRIGLRQMSGILVVAFCRTQLSRHVGELASASVACGVLGVGGNKGAAAINFTVYRRRFVFLCSHFAAHQDKVEERNNDYSKIVKNLKFKNSSTTKSASSSNNDRSIHNTVDGEGGSSLASDRWMNDGAAGSQVEAGPGLRDAEVVIWMGDFNYRISPVTYDEAVTAARQGRARELLLPKDQLRNEAEKGNVFHGLYEVPPAFPPTYKFDKGAYSEEGGEGKEWVLPYDSSEKKRIPAWTDRILWRGTAPSPTGYDPNSMPMHPEEIIVSPLSYDATLTVCESDHKPIALALDLTVPGFDQELKRKLSFEALSRGVATSDPSVLQPPSIVVTREGQEMSSLLPGLGPVPLLRITGAATKILVTNTSHVPAAVVIGHYGDYSSERLKLPSWLDVTPCVFYLEGQGIKEVSIRASHTDTIYAQQYPLEAIIAVMAQNAVLGAGVGGWRNANDKSAILVIDAHPGS